MEKRATKRLLEVDGKHGEKEVESSEPDLKCKKCDTDNEENYFRCYADINIHEQMLADKARTLAYRRALLENAHRLQKCTVLDVGAGTGILSHFAVQAGASRVYAVEPTDIAKFAERIAKDNNVDDRIKVIKSKIEDANVPVQVDAIVSEWMGYSLLYESMLPSVLHARDKYLKQGGDMYPCRATLYLAPINDADFQHRLDGWQQMKDDYGVSMESLKVLTRNSLTKCADNRYLAVESILARASVLKEFDLKTMDCQEAKSVQASFHFKCYGHNTMHGLAIWFTVSFPGSVTLDTSPFSPETHWGQTVVYFTEEFKVEQDTKISGTYKMEPASDNPRYWNINVELSVPGSDKVFSQTWRCAE